MAYDTDIDSVASCTVDPLFRALQLGHEVGEASYEGGVLRLKNDQERYIKHLNKTNEEQAKLRDKETNLSFWKRIGNFVGVIFTALTLVAGISAAAAGSHLIGGALIVACIWRIGSLVVQSLNKQKAILDALVPQELVERKKICRVLEISAQTVDVTAQLIMAIGSAWAALKIAQQYKNVFQLASFIATSAQATTSAVVTTKQARASFLRADVSHHQAQNDLAKRQIDHQRSELERLGNYLKDLAKTVGSTLETDHGAKHSIFNEG